MNDKKENEVPDGTIKTDTCTCTLHSLADMLLPDEERMNTLLKPVIDQFKIALLSSIVTDSATSLTITFAKPENGVAGEFSSQLEEEKTMALDKMPVQEIIAAITPTLVFRLNADHERREKIKFLNTAKAFFESLKKRHAENDDDEDDGTQQDTYRA